MAIKNNHFNPLYLWWAGTNKIVQPGEILLKKISGFDDDIERWFKNKHGEEIQLLPEKEAEKMMNPEPMQSETPVVVTPEVPPADTNTKKKKDE